jgi:hypothetical protein
MYVCMYYFNSLLSLFTLWPVSNAIRSERRENIR